MRCLVAGGTPSSSGAGAAGARVVESFQLQLSKARRWMPVAQAGRQLGTWVPRHPGRRALSAGAAPAGATAPQTTRHQRCAHPQCPAGGPGGGGGWVGGGVRGRIMTLGAAPWRGRQPCISPLPSQRHHAPHARPPPPPRPGVHTCGTPPRGLHTGTWLCQRPHAPHNLAHAAPTPLSCAPAVRRRRLPPRLRPAASGLPAPCCAGRRPTAGARQSTRRHGGSGLQGGGGGAWVVWFGGIILLASFLTRQPLSHPCSVAQPWRRVHPLQPCAAVASSSAEPSSRWPPSHTAAPASSILVHRPGKGTESYRPAPANASKSSPARKGRGRCRRAPPLHFGPFPCFLRLHWAPSLPPHSTHLPACSSAKQDIPAQRSTAWPATHRLSRSAR